MSYLYNKNPNANIKAAISRLFIRVIGILACLAFYMSAKAAEHAVIEASVEHAVIQPNPGDLTGSNQSLAPSSADNLFVYMSNGNAPGTPENTLGQTEEKGGSRIQGVAMGAAPGVQSCCAIGRFLTECSQTTDETKK